jgi:hypothetical protein
MKLLSAVLCVFLVNCVASHYNYIQHRDEEHHHHEEHHDSTTETAAASYNFTFEIPTSSPRCIELNQHRDDLRDCCDYPRIHVFKIFSTHCIDECVGSKDICCPMLCMWRNTKVKFDDGKVNLEGLKRTLIDSVRHKEEWEHLVGKAVDQCDLEGK